MWLLNTSTVELNSGGYAILSHVWSRDNEDTFQETSSAELTETINSMFRYYQLPMIIGPDFARSKWHTRGWTLQELIAPKVVLFFASDWTLIGTKFELARSLERITRIPQPVLQLNQDITTVSIAARMSWAARRETTRVEDGHTVCSVVRDQYADAIREGSNAFYRLQEAIMRTSPTCR
ncbi:uncharacterized protein BXZ73DRAFT_87838 [Epithele typhae]|uniref:uncharacterized protein n=1 Tax=Epithele typhae TaxID=378194 RepID=UPI002007C7C7|nr:uncharacterized protein BXZ73DRAFT_87838 [Epithele typhae]KAH9942149.1 hypothetical protein BXZ73DRAFT_87838 [Epithele typhae]